MRFGVSARALFRPGYGAARLLADLLLAILKTDTSHEMVLFLDRPLPKNSPFQSFEHHVIGFDTHNLFSRALWDHYLLGKAAVLQKIDCMLCPLHVRPLYCPVPSVVIVHDMMYHLYPKEWGPLEGVYMRMGTSLLSTRASAIVFISWSTANDFKTLFPNCSVIKEVIYPGVPSFVENWEENSSNIQSEKIHSPFILALGSKYPRKNIESLLMAFHAASTQIPHDLVIAGHLSREQLKDFEAMLQGVRDRVHFLGLVDDRILAALYRSAEFLVFPSRYEGFGFPVLEAMYSGCPVICSNAGSLSEVIGDAGLLFNPNSIEELQSCLCTLGQNSSLRTDLSARAKFRSKNFSYRDSALRFLEIMELVATTRTRV